MTQETLMAIIAALSGGGLTSLLVIPYTRKKAKAEAERSVVDNYETYTTRIEARLKELEDEVKKLREQNILFRNAIMSGYRCPFLRDHPSSVCPVQEEYSKHQEGGEE